MLILEESMSEIAVKKKRGGGRWKKKC